MTYIVAVYDVSLGYGGPEEGGWWYQQGSLTRICKVFRSESRAVVYCQRLNDRLASRAIGPNQGRREMTSVLSDGEFRAEIHENTAPAGYPSRRPVYE